MRNYTALNLARVNYNFSSPTDPPVASVEVFGVSLDDVLAKVTAMQGALGGIQITDIQDEGIWYLLLDKNNISLALNTKSAGRFLGDGVFIPAGGTPFAYPAEPPRDEAATFEQSNTPRAGWKDSDGNQRTGEQVGKGARAGAQSVDGLLQLLIGHMLQRKPPRPDIAAKLAQILAEHIRCEHAAGKNKDKLLACDVNALEELGALQRQYPGLFGS